MAYWGCGMDEGGGRAAADVVRRPSFRFVFSSMYLDWTGLCIAASLHHGMAP